MTESSASTRLGLDTKSKTALITGGGGGLGSVIAEVMLADGFCVAIVDHNGDRVAATAERLIADMPEEGRVLAITADITKSEQVERAVATVMNEWGRLDALVNNAGIEPAHTFENLDQATWQRVQEVNLLGPLILIQQCVPIWRHQGSGRIVNIGSRTWMVGGATVAYATSKAGIIGLTRSAATELGSLGVTANVVAPSFVRTPLNETKGDDDAVADFAARFAVLSPLGRLIDPVDVAYAVSYLASDRARNVTGEVLHVAAGTQLAPLPQPWRA